MGPQWWSGYPTEDVAAVLGAVIGALLAGVIGVATALIHDSLRQRRDHAEIAGALRAEVDRISDELFKEQPVHYHEPMLGTVIVDPPTVHCWMEGLIPRAAAIDPAIVTAFMRLDRDCNNRRTFVMEWRTTAKKLGEAKGTLTRRQQQQPPAHPDVTEAKFALDLAEMNEKMASDMALHYESGVRSHLTELRNLLQPFTTRERWMARLKRRAGTTSRIE